MKVEYVRTKSLMWTGLTIHTYRIDTYECSIELQSESSIPIGRQLGMEIERVMRQVEAAKSDYEIRKAEKTEKAGKVGEAK